MYTPESGWVRPEEANLEGEEEQEAVVAAGEEWMRRRKTLLGFNDKVEGHTAEAAAAAAVESGHRRCAAVIVLPGEMLQVTTLVGLFYPSSRSLLPL